VRPDQLSAVADRGVGVGKLQWIDLHVALADREVDVVPADQGRSVRPLW